MTKSRSDDKATQWRLSPQDDYRCEAAKSNAAPKTPAESPSLGFTMGVNTSPELKMYFLIRTIPSV
jgi:hypothetical protein